MGLEWDEAKRQETIVSRGLDFSDIALIDISGALTIPDNRRDYGEPRYRSFAKLEGELINFVWTPRGNRIRIISMRKANERERKAYEAR